MGYRIELEEIEAALSSIKCINECAIVYQDLGGNLGRIIGFASINNNSTSEELISEVASLLPSYMVPKRIHFLDSLPKNANGKIDRKALLSTVK